jgi:hypothetical protein
MKQQHIYIFFVAEEQQTTQISLRWFQNFRGTFFRNPYGLMVKNQTQFVCVQFLAGNQPSEIEFLALTLGVDWTPWSEIY